MGRFGGWPCLRRPCLFRLAGKDRGEKGRWVTVWCVLRVQFKQEPIFFVSNTHTHPAGAMVRAACYGTTKFVSSYV